MESPEPPEEDFGLAVEHPEPEEGTNFIGCELWPKEELWATVIDEVVGRANIVVHDHERVSAFRHVGAPAVAIGIDDPILELDSPQQRANPESQSHNDGDEDEYEDEVDLIHGRFSCWLPSLKC